MITQLRSPRAPDILALAGHNTLTTVQWQLRRDTTNHGPLILSSTFWGSEYDQTGKLFVSVNAGAIRLLVPAAHA